MVNSTSSSDHTHVEDGLLYNYKTYEGINLESIMAGFNLDFEGCAFVAFNIMDPRGMAVADKLGCSDYLFSLTNHWVVNKGPFVPIEAIHNEIKVKQDLQESWRKQMTLAVRNNDCEVLGRLWINIPAVLSDMWQYCTDYEVGMFFIRQQVAIPNYQVPKMLCNKINIHVFEELLKLNMIDANGRFGMRTYLMDAILFNGNGKQINKGNLYYDYVRLLLDYGADPAMTCYGFTALNCAETQVNSYKMYNLILGYIDRK